MTRKPGKTRQQRSGAAVVEFAVVVPVVLMLLMAIFEYGRFAFTLTTATSAVRDGARFAVVHTADRTTAQVQTEIDNRMGPAKNQISGYTTKVFWVDPAQLAPATGTPVIAAKTGFTGADDWKKTPFGDKLACEISGTFRPVLASILRAPTSFTLKVQEMVTSEAN